MKTPGWAIFVGIMMILVGGCGALSDVQAIYSPKLLSMNDGFLEKLEENRRQDSIEQANPKSVNESVNESDTSEEETIIEESEEDNTLKDSMDLGGFHFEYSSEEDEEIPDNMKEIMSISDHYKTWIVRFGYIGIIFSLLYIISGFFMIARQKFSLKLAYITLGACIVFALVQIFVLTMGEKNFFSIASSAAAGGGILLDIIFLIIITACDTTAYEPEAFS